MNKKLLIDFETRSRCDLKKCGQHMYARHASTEIICIGWKIMGEKTAHVIPMEAVYSDDPVFLRQILKFVEAVNRADYLVAHNVGFEYAIWHHCLLTRTNLGKMLPEIPHNKWICTLAMSSVLALPRGLDAAGQAIGLDHKKDIEGRKLLLKMCKPTPPKDNIGAWIEWRESQPELERLYEYCKQDLWTEEALYNFLIKYQPFTKKEYQAWVDTEKINNRGFKIDIELVDAVLEKINRFEVAAHERLRYHTSGLVNTPKQVKALREFLSGEGIELPDLQKKTVDDKLNEIESNNLEVSEDALTVLKIRQALGKSSTSKYIAFKNRMDDDHRVRNNLVYHGASTGRDSGQGVQPQNFPRGTVKIGERAVYSLIKDSIDEIELCYGPLMDVCSSALRSVIIPTTGYTLFCADFASIEARMLLWLAGDAAGLEEYERGLDTYITMAGTIYKEDWRKIEEEYKREGFSLKRHLGKFAILGLGYQMGAQKFIDTCKSQGIHVEDALAIRAHAAFREKYPLIPKLWKNYERAAILAVESKKKILINRVTWYLDRDFLFAELPSGRRLAYFRPEIRIEETPFGLPGKKLYIYTTDSMTKKWAQRAVYGGLLAENITQAVSRDCMIEATTRCEDAGYSCLIRVHDENLTEIKDGVGGIEEFKKLMSIRPQWGQDIPLKVSAWSGKRYRK